MLGGGALIAGGVGYSIHSNLLEVTQHHLSGVLPGSGGLKIAVVADLHAPRTLVSLDALAERVNEADCDALFIVGDTIDRSGNEVLVKEIFKALRVRGPKLAVLGNWEYWGGVDLRKLSKAYEAAGVQLLRNETVVVDFKDGKVTVVGLDDLISGQPEFDLVSAEEFQIILAHCPGSFDRIRALADHPCLMISGHTHGGQISPFGLVLWLPPGSGGYSRGWYHVGNHKLFVSRSLGNSVIPFRLGSRPELAIIELS